MFRRDVSNVPGDLVDGEVGASDLMEALWLCLEEENVANDDGQEEEESGDDRDDEEVGGSCSNPEEMNESEEDYEEDPPGLIQDEDQDKDEDKDEDEDHDQEHGHVGRAKRITRERITVGDTMNDDDYR